MNALPSSAYAVSPGAASPPERASVHPTVPSSPLRDRTGAGPMFIRMNAPVPYVHLASPASTQSWPNSAAC